MKQKYQMLLSVPIWMPVFLLTMLVTALLTPKEFIKAGKDFFEIIRWAWKN